MNRIFELKSNIDILVELVRGVTQGDNRIPTSPFFQNNSRDLLVVLCLTSLGSTSP